MKVNYRRDVIKREAYIFPVYRIGLSGSESSLYCSNAVLCEFKSILYSLNLNEMIAKDSAKVRVRLPSSASPTIEAQKIGDDFIVNSVLRGGKQYAVLYAQRALKWENPLLEGNNDLLLGTSMWFEDTGVELGTHVAIMTPI